MTAIALSRTSHVAVARPPRVGLLPMLRAWLMYRRTLAEMQDADPRTCRDLGIPTRPADPALQSFRIDPRPLWAIGQTPVPRPDRG